MNNQPFSMNEEMKKMMMKINTNQARNNNISQNLNNNYNNNFNNFPYHNIPISNYQNQYNYSNNNNDNFQQFPYNNKRNRNDFLNDVEGQNEIDNINNKNNPNFNLKKFRKIPKKNEMIEPKLNDNQNEFQKRNLDINQFNQKIEENLNYYKQKSKQIFNKNQKDNNFFNNGGNNNNFSPNYTQSINNEKSSNNLNYNEINTNKFPKLQNSQNNSSNNKNNQSINKPKSNLINPISNQIENNLNHMNQNISSRSNLSLSQNQHMSSHSKQIIVEIKEPVVSDFNIQEIKKIDFISFNKGFKKITKNFGFIIIISGIIVYIVYILSNKKQKEEILQALKLISPNIILSLSITIFVIFVIIYFIMKKNEEDFYNDIAENDYTLLEELLKGRNDDFIGIFQNQFISEQCQRRNLPESKYKKYVLPILKNLIKRKNKIIDAQIIISEQTQDIWRLKEENKK